MSDIQLHEIDFETVRTCQDVKKLKTIIELLKKEPYYPELLQSAMDRLNDLSPESALEMSPASCLDIPDSSDVSQFSEWLCQQDRIDKMVCNQQSRTITAPGNSSDIQNCLQTADERRAINQKTIGNEYYKSQDYSTAIKHYTSSIEIAPSNSETQSVCYFNRANCNFQMKIWKKCEKDCTSALDINSNYVKAYFLRAKVRDLLNKLQPAIDDLNMALRIEPGNDNLASLLENLKLKLPAAVQESKTPKFTRLKIVEVEEDDNFDINENEENGGQVITT